MLSLIPSQSQGQCSSNVSRGRQGPAHVDELIHIEDSLLPFKQMLSDASRPNLRLYCNIPTWNSSSTHCADLHDLSELRNRALLFLHDLLKALRTIGVQASYHLVPSSLDMFQVHALLPDKKPTGRPSSTHEEVLRKARLSERGKTFMAVSENGPVIVMT